MESRGFYQSIQSIPIENTIIRQLSHICIESNKSLTGIFLIIVTV